MDELQRALQNLDEIETVLKKNDYPGSNPQALSRIKFLAIQLKGANSYISEKAGKIAEFADIFYSARKHQKYPGGPDRIYSEMLHDLPARIRGQAEHLTRLRNEQNDL